jgi:hypothetical protein
MVEVYVSDVKNAIYLVDHGRGTTTIIAFPEGERPISDFYWGFSCNYDGDDEYAYRQYAVECRLESETMNEYPISFEELERWVEFWDGELLYCVCLSSIGTQYRMMSLQDAKINYDTFLKVDYHPKVLKLLVEACNSLIGSWGYLMGIKQGLVRGLMLEG